MACGDSAGTGVGKAWRALGERGQVWRAGGGGGDRCDGGDGRRDDFDFIDARPLLSCGWFVNHHVPPTAAAKHTSRRDSIYTPNLCSQNSYLSRTSSSRLAYPHIQTPAQLMNRFPHRNCNCYRYNESGTKPPTTRSPISYISITAGSASFAKAQLTPLQMALFESSHLSTVPPGKQPHSSNHKIRI